MQDAHVLLMSSDVDDSLLLFLLSSLTQEGISIVVGPGIGGYPSYADQHDAAVLLLVVGPAGLAEQLPYPISEFSESGQAVVVTFGGKSDSVSTMNGLLCFDLGEAPKVASQGFDRLVGYLRALLRSGLRLEYRLKLDEQVNATLTSVEKLQVLTTRIGILHTVLSEEEEHSTALRETLAEIGHTYQVVQDAIETFHAAGLTLNRSDGEAFARLARGWLERAIHNGRAHCTRIGVRYKRVGGLRDEIKDKLSAEALRALDETFEDLANADGDVFSVMDQLGAALTAESRGIVRLLLTDRKEDARKHVALAAKRLEPLEKALDKALHAFQHIQSLLGYAEPVPREREEIHVTNQTINMNFYGNVVNSNVVAAKTVENSFNTLAKSEVGKEMKSALIELHKATAELTTHLADDEAQRAACDLEELAKEATSKSPRPAFWRRAADGLLSAAEKVATAGIPVVELVSKVTAMLGTPSGS
jgi:hypothetical protein